MDKSTFFWTALKYICFLGNVIALIIWSHSSIKHFLDWPTSSSIFLSYGDKGDMQTRFPVVTICRQISTDDQESKNAWNNQTFCKPPEGMMFLSYLEGCMAKNPNKPLESILKNITYKQQDIIKDVFFSGIEKGNLKRLQDHAKWNANKNKVFYDMYDINHGHCFTIDVSPLTEKGTVPILRSTGNVEMMFRTDLDSKRTTDNKNWIAFLHNGSDIYSLHQNLPRLGLSPVSSFYFTIKKTILNSLPTKNYKCVKNHFLTCLVNTLAKDIKDKFNCSIPFFEKNSKTKVCSNKIILDIIKIIQFQVINSNGTYGPCIFGKPCQDMIYSITNRNIAYDKSHLETYIKYENSLIEIIEDAYSYPFISIFAELGGVLGMLLGLSFFGIFEIIIERLKHFFGN